MASVSVPSDGSATRMRARDVSHANGAAGAAERRQLQDALDGEARIPAELAQSVSAEMWWSYILSRRDNPQPAGTEETGEAAADAAAALDAAPEDADRLPAAEQCSPPDAVPVDAVPVAPAAIAPSVDDQSSSLEALAFHDALSHALTVHAHDAHLDEHRADLPPAEHIEAGPRIELDDPAPVPAAGPLSGASRYRFAQTGLALAGCALASLLLSPLSFGTRHSGASLIASPALASLGSAPSETAHATLGDLERPVQSVAASAGEIDARRRDATAVTGARLEPAASTAALPHVVIAAQSASVSAVAGSTGKAIPGNDLEPILLVPPRLVARRPAQDSADARRSLAAARTQPDYPPPPTPPAETAAPAAQPQSPLPPPKARAQATVRPRPVSSYAFPHQAAAPRPLARTDGARGHRPTPARAIRTARKAPVARVASLEPVFRLAAAPQEPAASETFELFGVTVSRSLPPWAYDVFFGMTR